MTEPTWEDPPRPSTGQKGVWMERLTPLMSQPGRWANLGTFAPNAADHLRKRTYRYPPGNWEFTTRDAKSTSPTLYARYLGPKETS